MMYGTFFFFLLNSLYQGSTNNQKLQIQQRYSWKQWPTFIHQIHLTIVFTITISILSSLHFEIFLQAFLVVLLNSWNIRGKRTQRAEATRPKPGQIDPEDEEHVGGNTWQKGTGGSDTAGPFFSKFLRNFIWFLYCLCHWLFFYYCTH